MARKQQPVNPPGNRQAAYSARNRASLIEHAQEVLAEIGPDATVEQISAHAQVSPTTLYKYFDNKEALFAEALDTAWKEWVVWSYGGVAPASSLEAVLDTARKILWVDRTHPLLAKMIRNSLERPSFFLAAVQDGAAKTLRTLSKNGILPTEDFDKRMILWGNAGVGLLAAVHVTRQLTPAEAEESMAIALSIWGISEAKAKKLMSRPLVFPPTK